MLGLYIHIPFCNNICSYCDFPKSIATLKKKTLYVDKLIKDIETIDDKIDTIYLGGGTPNSLNNNDLERIFMALKKFNPIEFTIELNPELLTKNQVQLFKQYGINRVSLGCQSFNEKIINTILRKHTKEDIIKAVEMLKEENITNINIDMMYAIPGQTINDILEDIDFYLKLDVPHISYYSLILEEKTILYHQYKNKKIELIDEDLESEMYMLIMTKLKESGYTHYEISNFAKKGFESIHNQIYWHNEKYYGLGLGASGYIGNTRYTNSMKFNEYLLSKYETELISLDEALKEEMMLGLRLIDGISIKDVEEKYQISLFKRFKEINQLITKGLLEISSGRLKLTEKGIFLGNEVFEIFV